MQLQHEEVSFKQKKFPIVLVCDNILYQPNIGSIFRICEAFGVEKILFYGIGNQMNPRKINKTSRNTHLQVAYELFETRETIYQNLVENGFEIISLELTTESKPLSEIKIIENKKIALVIGNEINGVSDFFLKKSNQITHIEMFGKNSSMNVVQATGIALYEIIKHLNNITQR